MKTRKKRRRFRHLNQFDRDRIETLLKADEEQKVISEVLQVDAGTISREINRRKQKNGRYSATAAEHKASVKRSNSKYQGMKMEQFPLAKQEIIKDLIQGRSPDEIAGRRKLDGKEISIGKDAIYKWLYSPWGQQYCRYLCTHRYKKRKQKRKTKREMIPNAILIHLRPLGGEHAEGDLFVSPISSGTQRSGAVMVVPYSKLIVGTMVENKKPDTFVLAVERMKRGVLVDDITLDRGIENRYHEQLSLPAYFCDGHSPWQKPHVENEIGLLRRWRIRRGTNLNNITEEDLQEGLHFLNGKYRKSLGYRSAYEVSLEHGIILKVPVVQKIPGGKTGEVTKESNKKMIEITHQINTVKSCISL